MAIPNRPGPIYNVTINHPEDIERAINNKEEDKQKVLKILESRYCFGFEQAPNRLDVGHLSVGREKTRSFRAEMNRAFRLTNS